MTAFPADVTALRFLGGTVCLDFVNSIENRDGDAPEDFIDSFAGLIRWEQHRGLLSGDDAARFAAVAGGQPRHADATLAEALELRDALHQVFRRIATSGATAADLEESPGLSSIEHVYHRTMAHARLRPVEDRLAWVWPDDDDHLDRLLWAIVRSAVTLLTEGDLGRVKLCANPHGCGWLFYDGSKNGSRRWCSMEGCGSSIKNRRQYARRRARQAADAG